MLKRIIPSTNESLPAVGVGTWQTFDVGLDQYKKDELGKVLKNMTAHGGSVVDSSPMYGRSEQVVGELVEKCGLRDSVFIATKVWTTGKDAGIRQMEKSMRLLKTRKVDLMQIHNLVDWKTHLSTLRDWKEDDKIKYIGITHYNPGGYESMEKIMKTEVIDFIQVNYSLRRREAEERILPLAKDNGIAVLINLPFDGRSLFSLVKDKKLPEWAKEFDYDSWSQYFLKYILSNPDVTCVIPGTANPSHIADNMKAGSGRLPDNETRSRMIRYLEE